MKSSSALAWIGWILIIVLTAPLLSPFESRCLWPVFVALLTAVVTHRALPGLLLGWLAGLSLIFSAEPTALPGWFFESQFLAVVTSTWKMGALIFTLILGGFAAVFESSPGFRRCFRWLMQRGNFDAPRRFQLAVFALGLICFFDGLANSLLVGRVGRSESARYGVSKAKLAYLTDSLSSAVACVALISTWIAFQLSMIENSYASIGQLINPYSIFLGSLPYNYYCWLTISMTLVVILTKFHLGPMRAHEQRAALSVTEDGPVTSISYLQVLWGLAPLALLLSAMLLSFYYLGVDSLWPITWAKLISAFGGPNGPYAMILGSLLGSGAVIAVHQKRRQALWIFFGGAGDMVRPLLVLIAAWLLGGVLQELATAEYLARLAAAGDVRWSPALVFCLGAVMSLATGTSWGTMGILFPLTIPAVASLPGGEDAGILLQVVAAVFSGAVFGDHCSPFSDTTIVSSIAAGVDTHTHVVTQLPYALVTASVALACGFLAVPFGLWTAWVGMLVALGLQILIGLSSRSHKPPPQTN